MISSVTTRSIPLARVLRRAARSVVALADGGYPVSPEVRRYVNRTSDLLFVLARAAAGENEPPSHD